MIVYVLFSIVIIYLLLVLIKDFAYKKTKIKICAICGAVSLTWVVMLILALLGYNIDKLLLGILMGESIVGIMYSLENKIKNKLASSFVKLFTISIGTIVVYFILGVI